MSEILDQALVLLVQLVEPLRIISSADQAKLLAISTQPSRNASEACARLSEISCSSTFVLAADCTKDKAACISFTGFDEGPKIDKSKDLYSSNQQYLR